MRKDLQSIADKIALANNFPPQLVVRDPDYPIEDIYTDFYGTGKNLLHAKTYILGDISKSGTELGVLAHELGHVKDAYDLGRESHKRPLRIREFAADANAVRFGYKKDILESLRILAANDTMEPWTPSPDAYPLTSERIAAIEAIKE